MALRQNNIYQLQAAGSMLTHSLAEWSTAVIRDQVQDHDVATPALFCHKEPARRLYMQHTSNKCIVNRINLYHQVTVVLQGAAPCVC